MTNSREMRAKIIGKHLQTLFPDPQIPLSHEDPYTLLVAVTLSAQTTDKRVNSVTPELFARAGTPEGMLQLPADELTTIIRPCGLAKTKAKHLIAMAEKLTSDFGGKVPTSFKELESLPGVGHKTASVVMVQAFGKPAFPVDTHIHRLAKQWGLSSGKNVKTTEKDLKQLFPEAEWGKIHLQIILYGRKYSPARGFSKQKSPIDLALENLEQ